MELSSSFAEYLELCLADKGLEQIPGTENIPDNILMKHVKAVWNSAVQLSDDFHQERLAATAWGAALQVQETGVAFSQKSAKNKLVLSASHFAMLL